MNNKRALSGGDFVAIILAAVLSLTILIATVAILVFNHSLNESAEKLFTAIGVGLVGSLSVYMGHAIASRPDREDD